jgi:hypothetical protein
MAATAAGGMVVGAAGVRAALVEAEFASGASGIAGADVICAAGAEEGSEIVSPLCDVVAALFGTTMVCDSSSPGVGAALRLADIWPWR